MVEDIQYNPWPLPFDTGLQRIELQQLKVLGYEFNDPREVIDLFEKKVAKFAGSKYAISVDCCTHAMELCFRYLFTTRLLKSNSIVIPDNTYVSVYWMLVQLGMKPVLVEQEWSGIYQLGFTPIYDSAVRWNEGIYIGGEALQCLSFQIKKPIPIGRGGCILTDDKEAYDWLRLARYDGRDMSVGYDQPGHVKMMGYHYYMSCEDAARGILLMDKVTFRGDSGGSKNYPSITEILKSCEH